MLTNFIYNDLISRALTHSKAAALPSFRGPWRLDPRVTVRLRLILSHKKHHVGAAEGYKGKILHLVQ